MPLPSFSSWLALKLERRRVKRERGTNGRGSGSGGAGVGVKGKSRDKGGSLIKGVVVVCEESVHPIPIDKEGIKQPASNLLHPSHPTNNGIPPAVDKAVSVPSSSEKEPIRNFILEGTNSSAPPPPPLSSHSSSSSSSSTDTTPKPNPNRKPHATDLTPHSSVSSSSSTFSNSSSSSTQPNNATQADQPAKPTSASATPKPTPRKPHKKLPKIPITNNPPTPQARHSLHIDVYAHAASLIPSHPIHQASAATLGRHSTSNASISRSSPPRRGSWMASRRDSILRTVDVVVCGAGNGFVDVGGENGKGRGGKEWKEASATVDYGNGGLGDATKKGDGVSAMGPQNGSTQPGKIEGVGIDKTQPTKRYSVPNPTAKPDFTKRNSFPTSVVGNIDLTIDIDVEASSRISSTPPSTPKSSRVATPQTSFEHQRMTSTYPNHRISHRPPSLLLRTCRSVPLPAIPHNRQSNRNSVAAGARRRVTDDGCYSPAATEGKMRTGMPVMLVGVYYGTPGR